MPRGFCFGAVEGSRLPPGGLSSSKATRPAVTEPRPSLGGAGQAVTSSPPPGGPARLLACSPARPTGAAAPGAGVRRGRSCGRWRVCTAPGALSLRSCGCFYPLDPRAWPLVAQVL